MSTITKAQMADLLVGNVNGITDPTQFKSKKKAAQVQAHVEKEVAELDQLIAEDKDGKVFLYNHKVYQDLEEALFYEQGFHYKCNVNLRIFEIDLNSRSITKASEAWDFKKPLVDVKHPDATNIKSLYDYAVSNQRSRNPKYNSWNGKQKTDFKTKLSQWRPSLSFTSADVFIDPENSCS